MNNQVQQRISEGFHICGQNSSCWQEMTWLWLWEFPAKHACVTPPSADLTPAALTESGSHGGCVCVLVDLKIGRLYMPSLPFNLHSPVWMDYTVCANAMHHVNEWSTIFIKGSVTKRWLGRMLAVQNTRLSHHKFDSVCFSKTVIIHNNKYQHISHLSDK